MLIGHQVEEFILDPLGFGKIEQSGFDLTVKSIKQVDTTEKGYWFSQGQWHQPAILRSKTHLPTHLYTPLPLHIHKFEVEGEPVSGWFLNKGVYSITFDQGIKLPCDVTGIVVHRSSVARVGGEISAGIYDPGFQTENIGAILSLSRSLFVEEHSSLAKIIMFSHEEVVDELLYRGQYYKEDPK